MTGAGMGPKNETSLAPIRANIEARPVWRSPGPDFTGPQANADLPFGINDTLLPALIEGKNASFSRCRSVLHIDQFTLGYIQQWAVFKMANMP